MPCTEPNLVKTLTDKHSRLQGLAVREGPERYMLDLYHVECVIRMFAPDWRPTKPIAPRGPFIFGKRGALMVCALAVLREAEQLLTAKEIAVAMLAKAGRDDPELVLPVVRRLLPRLPKRAVRHEGKPLRWTLSPLGGWRNGDSV